MKNVILIDTNGEKLIASTDDGTNTLYINGTEINSSDWVGTGNYTATIAGHAITIAKVSANTGNIIINKISDYNYELSQTRYMPPGLLDAIYPVGSIYMSVNAVDPGMLFGGTWTQIKDRFLLSAGDTYDNGATGGAATVTLTANQIPEHRHAPNVSGELFVTSSDSEANNTRVMYSSSGNRWVDGLTSQSHFHHRTNTGPIGGGQAHNNMPPYLVVNMWQRTA